VAAAYENLGVVNLIQGMNYNSRASLAEATAMLKQALRWIPTHTGANAALGVASGLTEGKIVALPYWKSAWEFGQRPPDGLRLGLAYETLDQLDLATRIWRDARADVFFATVGIDLLNRGRPGESRVYLERVLKIRECDVQVQNYLGRIYLALGNNQDAHRVYSEALRCAGGVLSADLHYGLAASLFQQFRQRVSQNEADWMLLDQVIAYLDQTLTLDPHYAMAYILKAQVLLDRGDREGAFSVYQQGYQNARGFFTVSPDSFTAHINLGLLYWKDKNDNEAAKKEFERAIAVLPTDPRGYLYLGNLMLETCQLEEVRALYKAAQERGADISTELGSLASRSTYCSR
jgi:tetratricopeptide (TPR) repeat protein